MALLPVFQTEDKNFQLMQNKWSSALNPVLANPSLQSSILKSVSLSTGSNTVNHRLGRQLQGWRIVRLRSAASIYDQQDSNQMQDLTLILVSSANCIVDLEVF